jgi:glycosyltransferase involved in cell wall biosynthesis
MTMKNETRSEPALIAFYCSSIAWGGLEMNTVRYATWMQSKGYQVLVYCVAESSIHHHAHQSGLAIELIPRNRKYFDFKNAYRISKSMRDKKVSLVWFRDTRDMDTLALAKRVFHLRIPFLYQQAMQFGVSKKDFFHTQRFRCIDAWVSTLPFLATQVRTMTHLDSTKIHVVPLGVPDLGSPDKNQSLRSKLQIDENAFTLGLIGRIDPLKGQQEALDALRLMHDAGHPMHLLFAGDNTLHEGDIYFHQLKASIERYQLSAYVHFIGHQKEIQPFFASIDCFLMCSKSETFGTVTIEAMSQKIPIIATHSGGTPEILDHGKCGLLYPPGDAPALANCILQMREDAVMRNKMIDAGSKRYEQEFTAEISIKRMVQIVEQLIAN